MKQKAIFKIVWKFRSIHCKYHFVNIFRKRNTIFSTFTLLSKKYWSFSWKYCMLAWLLKKRHQILSLFLSSKKYTLSSAWMFYWDCLTHVGSVKQGAKRIPNKLIRERHRLRLTRRCLRSNGPLKDIVLPMSVHLV